MIVDRLKEIEGDLLEKLEGSGPDVLSLQDKAEILSDLSRILFIRINLERESYGLDTLPKLPIEELTPSLKAIFNSSGVEPNDFFEKGRRV